MKKRLFFAAGAVVALSAGIVAMAHFSERNRQQSDLVLQNIEAMAWSSESFANSFSDCYSYSDANCCVIERSGDGKVVTTDHPGFIAKNSRTN